MMMFFSKEEYEDYMLIWGRIYGHMDTKYHTISVETDAFHICLPDFE
jgi:hypothetical protein